jgi:NADPH-dependent 2,4-dienoyl-CoA reductase/sulfur reductase-like enzyme/pSer/pThr/pTyr-binding forkhead associated (FHA) protein
MMKATMARRRFVIIGDGAAGLAAAERLRERDATATIGIFTDDPSPGYFRAALTNYLLGELREDQLWATSPDFYDSLGIKRVFGRVVAVDTQRSVIWDSTSPTPTPYDHLLVASGGRPRAPSFEGAHLPGVMTLRTIQDARQVVDHVRLRRLERAVVLGGGALGLEWAHALREHGVAVTLIEVAPRLLPNALDEVASDLLAARLRQAGIQVLLGDAVNAAQPGPDGAVRAVVTRSGQTLPCGLVAAALGVVPSSEFLKGSGITLSDRGAVLTDKTLVTNVKNVWAAGDVANVAGEAFQLWEPARKQALAAAENMLGGRAEYDPGVHYFATRLFDLDFARLGKVERADGREFLVDFPRGTGTIAYRKLALEGGRLVGTLMIGERSARVRALGRSYKRLIDGRVDVSQIQGKLLDPSFDFEGWLGTQKLFEKPPLRAGTQLVAGAKLRGTQLVKIGKGSPSEERGRFAAVAGGAGTQLVMKGTSLLKRPTAVITLPTPALSRGAASAGPSSAAPGSATPSTMQSPREGTRMLSIGLHAEATTAIPAALPPLDARLEGMGKSFPITRPTFSIGRNRDADVPIDHEAVASLHAQIERHADALYLRDAGSRTGTWVNRRLITSAHALADGDRLQIGPAEFSLRAPSLRRAAPAEAAPTAAELCVEVRSGQSVGLSFALRGDAILIGSAPGAGVELRDLSVAPQHARLRKAGAQLFLSDLGSGRATFVQQGALRPAQEVPIGEGGWCRVGTVDLVLVRGTPIAAAALRPRARLRVDSGPSAGGSIAVSESVIVGSGPGATLVIPGLAPVHLEVVLHEQSFWARDRSGGASFKSGSPLGGEFVELSHGESLLLGGHTMIRFEETP